MRLKTAVVATVMLLAACSGGSDEPVGVSVDTIQPDRALSGPVTAIGDVLLGADVTDDLRSNDLHRSPDGRTWTRFEVPGVTDRMDVQVPYRTGDIVVVGAKQRYEGPGLDAPPPPTFAWVSDDGERWRGGKVAEEVWTSVPPVVVDAGGLVLAGVTVGERFQLWRLDGARWGELDIPAIEVPDGEHAELVDAWRDGGGWRAIVARRSPVLLRSGDGRSWRAEPCPGDCAGALRSGGTLLSSRRVSHDGGRSWHRIQVPGRFDDVDWWFEDLADVDGQHFATVGTDTEVGMVGSLVRSSDGRRWREVRAPGCAGEQDLSAFVEVDGRVFLTRTCFRPGAEVVDLLQVVGDDVHDLATWRAGSGRPVVRDGHLLIALAGGDGRLRSIEVVRW